MMFKTHMAGSLVFSTLSIELLTYFNLNTTPEIVIPAIFASSAIGAMMPDLDSPNSKIRRIIRKALTGNPHTDINMINHRRVPHWPSFWAAVIIPAFLYAKFTQSNLFMALVFGFGVGVISHLFLDLLNPTGLALLAPVKRKKYRILRIRSGSGGETVVFFLLILFEIALVAYKFGLLPQNIII